MSLEKPEVPEFVRRKRIELDVLKLPIGHCREAETCPYKKAINSAVDLIIKQEDEIIALKAQIDKPPKGWLRHVEPD